MKKFSVLFILLALTLTSCSLDSDPSQSFNFEVMPITSVDMPEQFIHGEVYSIDINYIQPNNCYVFNRILYVIENNERTVTVVNTVYSNEGVNCVEDPTEVTASFDLTITSTETYVFKFFQGEDEDGLDYYHIVEVPVYDGRLLND